MAIAEIVSNDIKEAMKAKEKELLTTLRSLSSEIKQYEIDNRVVPTDEIIVSIIAKGIKTRQESAKQYAEGGRPDLEQSELTEIEVYKKYLPTQLTEDEIRTIVSDIISSTGATSTKDMGKIMGVLMPKVKGKADGALVNKVVKDLLPS